MFGNSMVVVFKLLYYILWVHAGRYKCTSGELLLHRLTVMDLREWSFMELESVVVCV